MSCVPSRFISIMFYGAVLLNAVGTFPWPQALSGVMLILVVLCSRKMHISTLIPLYVLYWITQLASFFSLRTDADVHAFGAYVLVALIDLAVILVVSFISQRSSVQWFASIMTMAVLVIGVAVVLSVFHLLHSGTPVSKIVQLRLVHTRLGSTNYLAVIAAILIPYCVACIVTTKKVVQWLGRAGLSSAFVIVLMSVSRTGSLIAVFSFVLSLLVYTRATRGSCKMYLTQFLVIVSWLVVSILVILFNFPGLGNKLILRWRALGTLSGRIPLWAETLTMLENGAWLNGIGVGQLIGETVATFPHNILLQVWVWTGVPGVLAFSILAWYLMSKSLRVLLWASQLYRGRGCLITGFDYHAPCWVGPAAAISVLAGLLASMVEISIGSPGFDFYFWTSAAVVGSMRLRS